MTPHKTEPRYHTICEVHWCNRTVIETPARAILVGLQTHRRVRLKATGGLESFCIIFQPGGRMRCATFP